VTRTILAVLLLASGVAGVAHAQTRPMPAYQDDESYGQPTVSDDQANSRDARRDAGYPAGYGDPKPRGADRQDSYSGYADVPPATGDGGEDAAHRADRLRTAELNHRANARPSGTTSSDSRGAYARQSAQYRAELADHARALRTYDDDRARYADRIARWRAQANACEAGNLEACQRQE
jgi:hypothetical protein